nr:hypothetical protein [Leptospira weilii]
METRGRATGARYAKKAKSMGDRSEIVEEIFQSIQRGKKSD